MDNPNNEIQEREILRLIAIEMGRLPAEATRDPNHEIPETRLTIIHTHTINADRLVIGNECPSAITLPSWASLQVGYISFEVTQGVCGALVVETELDDLALVPRINIQTQDTIPFLLENIIHARGIGTLAENISITLNGEENINVYAFQGETENDLSIIGSDDPVGLR